MPDLVHSYHDKAGTPITQDEWAKLYETRGYRNVARTRTSGALVSTIWTGGFSSHDPSAQPLIFETLVDSDLTEWTWTRQTATLAEAKAMHKAAVAWVKGNGPQPALTEWDLKFAEERFSELTVEAEKARERRNRILRDAVASGWSHARIAKATGLTRTRVGQIALGREGAGK